MSNIEIVKVQGNKELTRFDPVEKPWQTTRTRKKCTSFLSESC